MEVKTKEKTQEYKCKREDIRRVMLLTIEYIFARLL